MIVRNLELVSAVLWFLCGLFFAAGSAVDLLKNLWK
jgi:hypothetical protein